MTQNFTSTPIIIGYRRVIIPDYFHISVGDIIATMYSNDVNSIIIVIIFNNAYYYSLSDINIFIHVIYCMLSIFNTNNVKENRNEDNFYLLHYKT